MCEAAGHVRGGVTVALTHAVQQGCERGFQRFTDLQNDSIQFRQSYSQVPHILSCSLIDRQRKPLTSSVSKVTAASRD